MLFSLSFPRFVVRTTNNCLQRPSSRWTLPPSAMTIPSTVTFADSCSAPRWIGVERMRHVASNNKDEIDKLCFLICTTSSADCTDYADVMDEAKLSQNSISQNLRNLCNLRKSLTLDCATESSNIRAPICAATTTIWINPLFRS